MAEPVQVEVDDNESVTEDSKGDKSNNKDTETVHSISEGGKSKVLHNIEEEITGMINIKYLLCVRKLNICFNNPRLPVFYCYVTAQNQF